MDIPTLVNYTTAIVVFAVGGFLGIRYAFKGRVDDDNDKFISLRQSIEARDIEIADLNKKVDQIIIENKELRELNIKLTAEKQVLVDSLKGTDYLVALTKSVEQFQAWAKQASVEHQMIIQNTNDIKNLLTINKRNVDRKRP